MRRTVHTTAVGAMLAGAMLLSACGDQNRATFDETTPIQPAETARVSQEPTQSAAAPPAPEGHSTDGTAGLVPIDWPEAPRELTVLEKQFLYEPGPFAGDDYDEDAVVAAVLAQHPSTRAEWEEAIRAQVQEDLSDDFKTIVTFDPNLSPVGDEPTEGASRGPEDGAVGTNHFALVLDASGSMAAAAGSGTRMDEAKAAISTFVGSLPGGSTVSLRVYGHKGDNTKAGREVSCESTETIYEGSADSSQLVDRVQAVRPTGWTPLAAAIGAAEEDIPVGTTDGIVYVVTDGLETCGGDPVTAAKQLADSGIKPIVNVIGFHAEGADEAGLRAIAEAGGGEYTHADSQAELEKYWSQEYSQMMDAWAEWKNTEVQRISQEGNEKWWSAADVGNRLVERAARQGNRAVEVVNRLRADGHMDRETRNDVYSSLNDLKRDMWDYSQAAKSENMSASSTIKRDAMNEVYEKATSKWSEYYAKKRG